MNITMTLEGDATEKIVQRVCAAIGSVEETPSPAPKTKPEAIPAPAPKPAPKAKPEAAPTPKPKAAPKAAEEPAVDFAAITAAARAAYNRGKREGFAALLEARGVKAASEIDEAEYPALLAEIEAL